MHIFVEHVAVCNGQANAQNTKCTHFFQCTAVYNRQSTASKTNFYSVYCCLQWIMECTGKQLYSVYSCLQWITECTEKQTVFSAFMSAMDNEMHRKEPLFGAFLSAIDNPMCRVGGATIVAT